MKKILLILFLSTTLIGCNFTPETTTAELVLVDTTNYLEITTVEELKNIEMNKSYILMNNLDLTGEEWVPLGTYREPYLGNFDGNGMTISNLTISIDNQYNGLFGYVNGQVNDLKIIDFAIDYEAKLITFAGGLAGAISGHAYNIEVSGNIQIENTRSNTYVGLLVGMSVKMDESSAIANFIPVIINNNQSSGIINVVGERMIFAGGLIGKSFNSRVYDNLADSTIDVVANNSSAAVGGLIGHNYSGLSSGYEAERIALNIAVYNNISNSTINSQAIDYILYTGGLIGYNYFGYLYDNFSATDIVSDGKENCVGLLIGEDWHSDIQNVVVIGEINGLIQEDGTYHLGAFVGRSFGVSSVISSHWYEDSQQFSDMEGYVDFADLSNVTWYEFALEWDIDFINKLIGFIE